MTYWQALNYQQLQRAGNVIVLVERLPDCYRLTTRNGTVWITTLECGMKMHPIALCGKP